MEGLGGYIELVSAFVEGGMPAEEFESRYLQLTRTDTARFTEVEGRVLGDLFSSVDSFVSDPELRDNPAFDIDEVQLRSEAAQQLRKLRAIQATRSNGCRDLHSSDPEAGAQTTSVRRGPWPMRNISACRLPPGRRS